MDTSLQFSTSLNFQPVKFGSCVSLSTNVKKWDSVFYDVVYDTFALVFVLYALKLIALFQLMALGNQVGKVFVWDLDMGDPREGRFVFIYVFFIYP